MATQKKWYLDEENLKMVKLMSHSTKLSFQRKGPKNCSRGLTISIACFKKMEDVIHQPNASIELEKNVFLTNYGNRIHLNRCSCTRDLKRCENGFFYFTPEEWRSFWSTIRPSILERIEK